MKYADNPDRQRLLEQARHAVTLTEIDASETALWQWKEAHPDDVAIDDAFESLALMRLALTNAQTL